MDDLTDRPDAAIVDGLLRQVEELSDGAVRMGPGTLYGTLNRLVADGLIVETTNHAGRHDKERRRYYRLTAEGELVAKAEYARLRTLVARVGRLRPDLGRAATCAPPAPTSPPTAA